MLSKGEHSFSLGIHCSPGTTSELDSLSEPGSVMLLGLKAMLT